MITLTDRLRKLVNPRSRGKGRLAPAEDKPVILGGRGVGTRQEAEKGGAGITSPLVEQVDKRTYYDERFMRSSDGLFVIVYSPLASATFLDGDSNEVVVQYTDETAPLPEEPTP